MVVVTSSRQRCNERWDEAQCWAEVMPSELVGGKSVLSSQQAKRSCTQDGGHLCVQQSSTMQGAELPSEHGQVCSGKAVLKIKGKLMQKRTSCPPNPGPENGERTTPDRPDVCSEGS